MKKHPLYRTRRSSAGERARLLAAFDCSGLSAADFARKHQINYTTFCNWRQQRARTSPVPAFVQVDLPPQSAPAGLVVELGSSVRLHVHCASQVELAARLIQAFNAPAAC